MQAAIAVRIGMRLDPSVQLQPTHHVGVVIAARASCRSKDSLMVAPPVRNIENMPPVVLDIVVDPPNVAGLTKSFEVDVGLDAPSPDVIWPAAAE